MTLDVTHSMQWLASRSVPVWRLKKRIGVREVCRGSDEEAMLPLYPERAERILQRQPWWRERSVQRRGRYICGRGGNWMWR